MRKVPENLWNELNSQKTADELFRSIPAKIPEGFAAVLMYVLAVLPLLAGIFAFLDDGFFTRHIPLHTAFNTIGYGGLVFALFMLFWNKYNTEKKPRSFWQKLQDNGLWVFLSAMLMWSVLSTIFSTNPDISLLGDSYRMDGLASYFAYAGIFATAIQMHNKKHIRIILNIFVGAASILALLGILNIPIINAYMRITPQESIFSNTNHYGYYLCMSIMSAVLLFVCSGFGNHQKGKMALTYIVHGLELALIANALIQCKTLGSLVAVTVALIALILLTFFINRKSIKQVIIAVLIIVVSAGISSIDIWDFKAEAGRLSSDLNTISNSIFGESTDEAKIDRIGSGRGILLINAIKFIGERPIFGYGPDNLGERYCELGITKNDRPHNEVIQFAASLGITAAVLYLLAMFFHLLMLIRNFRHLDMITLCAYCIIGAYLISSLFGNTMFYTTPFYFMLLGISYALIREINSKSEEIQHNDPS